MQRFDNNDYFNILFFRTPLNDLARLAQCAKWTRNRFYTQIERLTPTQLLHKIFEMHPKDINLFFNRNNIRFHTLKYDPAHKNRERFALYILDFFKYRASYYMSQIEANDDFLIEARIFVDINNLPEQLYHSIAFMVNAATQHKLVDESTTIDAFLPWLYVPYTADVPFYRNLRDLSLKSCDLSNIDCSFVDFTDSALRQVYFGKTNLTGARFTPTETLFSCLIHAYYLDKQILNIDFFHLVPRTVGGIEHQLQTIFRMFLSNYDSGLAFSFQDLCAMAIHLNRPAPTLKLYNKARTELFSKLQTTIAKQLLKATEELAQTRIKAAIKILDDAKDNYLFTALFTPGIKARSFCKSLFIGKKSKTKAQILIESDLYKYEELGARLFIRAFGHAMVRR